MMLMIQQPRRMVGLCRLLLVLLSVSNLWVLAFQHPRVFVSTIDGRSEHTAAHTLRWESPGNTGGSSSHCKVIDLDRCRQTSCITHQSDHFPRGPISMHGKRSSSADHDVDDSDNSNRIGGTMSSRRVPLTQTDAHRQRSHQNQPSNRRAFLDGGTLLGTTAALMFSVVGQQPVSARGLVQFPCMTPMSNSYHCMRAGTTLLEEQGMWSTNPLFLTNRDDALSVAGQEQVVEACQLLQLGTRPPTLVKYSLAAGSMDTANSVARELKLGRDRLVPEFTFLDPRAIGAWDMSARDVASPAVWAMDNDEAGVDGLNGRPPPNVDGTPHEVLADQAVRLRQVMSILESQYSGDTILLIFPDGTGPALLSAMIAGIPYNRAHELEYEPGEIRFDVTRDSTLALWRTKQQQEGAEYQATLRRGRDSLNQLRATASNGGEVINLRDQKEEEERKTIEAAWKAKEDLRIRTEQNERDERLLRVREVQAANSNDASINNFGVLVGSTILASGAVVSFGGGSKNDTLTTETNSNTTGVSISQLESLSAAATRDGLFATVGLGSDSTVSGRNIVRYSPGGGSPRGVSSRAAAAPPAMIDPKVAAERAMEDYLNQDDGADDWLTSLSQIIDDPYDSRDVFSGDSAASAMQTSAIDLLVTAEDATSDRYTKDVMVLTRNSTSDADSDWDALSSSSPETLSAWDSDADSFQ